MNKSTTSLSRLIFIALLAVLLMSIVPVIIKWINANAATIGIVRLAIAAAGIAVLMAFSKSNSRFSRRDLSWLALLGFVFACHWYSYFLSIKLGDASLAAIGVATYGMHLLILSSLIKKEKLVLSDWFALIISFAGIYLASPSFNFEPEKMQGFLLAVLSGLLYASLPLINQQLAHLKTKPRALGQFGFALCAFLVLLPQADFNLSLVDWQGLLVLGVVSTLLGHTLWNKASTELPNNLTAVIYYAYVPIAMLLAYFLLDEIMTWQKIGGAFLIISANIMVVYLHNKSRL